APGREPAGAAPVSCCAAGNSGRVRREHAVTWDCSTVSGRIARVTPRICAGTAAAEAPGMRFLLLAFALAACGDDAVPQHGAADTTPDAPVASGLEFYEDVAPIFAEHCVTCHRPQGGAPFSLITYEDAMSVADVMGDP